MQDESSFNAGVLQRDCTLRNKEGGIGKLCNNFHTTEQLN